MTSIKKYESEILDPSQQMIHTEEEVSLIPSQKSKSEKLTFWLIFTVCSLIIGGIQFGYQVSVINTPADAIRKDCEQSNAFFKPCIPMNDVEWSIAVSIFPIGGLIGGLFGGKLADFIGRKLSVLSTNFFFILGALFMSLFSNFYIYSIGRLLMGIGSGWTSAVTNMYIAECSPDNLRGAMGTFFQLSITIGILLSQLLSLGLSFRPVGWRILMALPLIFSILSIVCIPFIPQSPIWLITKNKNEDAEKSLQRLRNRMDVTDELKGLKEAVQRKLEEKTSFISLFSKKTIKPLMIGVTLQIAQQWSGINLVFFYSTEIFKASNIGDYADLATAGIGTINVLATIVATFLMDKLGRRTLLLIGEILQTIFFTALTLTFIFKDIQPTFMSIIGVVSVVFYVIFFAIGLGPIPWMIMSELVPSNVRGYASSIAVAANWICTFGVAMSFKPLNNLLQSYTFIPFVVFNAVFLVFTWFVVPETKGRNIEEN